MVRCPRLWMLGQREFTATVRAELLFTECGGRTDGGAELQRI